MKGVLRSIVKCLTGGSGEYSITVPVMDGALKPNNYLDHIPAVGTLEEPDNLVSDGVTAYLTSGPTLYRVDHLGAMTATARETASVTSLALSPTGALAIGLATGGLRILGGRHDGKMFGINDRAQIGAPTAAVFTDDDTLVVCNGSAINPATEWRRDLLGLGRTGSVVKVDLASGAISTIADRLAWPSGVSLAGSGAVVVSEAWRHRLISLRLDGTAERATLADLPAYPGRIAAAAGGGYWLSLFAVRSQLQEFVLHEPRYRREMMASIDPSYWIAPSLSSGKSFKEPLQAGGVIRLGIHKPWAPTRSYGLVTRLDEQLQPVWSAHSRADGERHGITSVAELAGRALVTARGSNELLAIDHTELEEPLDLHIQAEAAQ